MLQRRATGAWRVGPNRWLPTAASPCTRVPPSTVPTANRPSLSQLAISLVAVAAASVAAAALDPYVSLAVLALVYLSAVLVVSYWVSFAASAVTALLAVIGLNFMFVPPRGTLTVHATENLLTLAALLGVSLLVSTLSSRLRSAVQVARQREQRARALQLLASEMSHIDNAAELVRAAQRSLHDAAGSPVTVALCDGQELRLHADAGHPAPPPDSPEHDALRHCSQEGQALGPGTGRSNELSRWYLPLRAGDVRMGALSVPAHERDDEVRDHAQAIADLLTGALQRTQHAAAAMHARTESEMQQQRSALLAAVSHDFRTPLASIVGAVSSLQTQHDKLGDRDRAGLLAKIDAEARHLSSVTENTLQWARLSGSEPVLRADWESIEEIIGSVLARVRRRDPHRRVKAEVPGGLPLVRADAVLLAQLIENLIDNALKYSDGPVQLSVHTEPGEIHVQVLDRGPGIPAEDLPRIFNMFYRGSSVSSVRGAGLGLAVGRSIALAHAGTLTAQPRAGGGTCFVLALPAPAAPSIASEAPS
jgi:two-component system sensor histidine kinase KdpD